MTTHTPTNDTPRPWEVGTMENGVSRIVTVNGYLIAKTGEPDDAAIIVERVNGWDAIVFERDALRGEAVELHRQLDEAVAERDALLEALRPFAAYACAEYDDTEPCVPPNECNNCRAKRLTARLDGKETTR